MSEQLPGLKRLADELRIARREQIDAMARTLEAEPSRHYPDMQQITLLAHLDCCIRAVEEEAEGNG